MTPLSPTASLCYLLLWLLSRKRGHSYEFVGTVFNTAMKQLVSLGPSASLLV